MDDTTQNRTSDAAAAATRKRRSSILKSQRPPRTPFCDLEFNVCTPTDTAKSRRVSFSRRTGVAEFATNEATNTWKNFYEEHNNSLESSGTDPDVNKHRQSIGHLGKRIFEQQFEEVEAVDFIGSLNPGININTSVNSFNFTQQFECTGSKLTAPHNKFELSAFTEQQSKVFADDLAGPYTGEVSDRIDVNFSTVQTIGDNDDLDEIQKDLQRQNNAAYCPGPFNGRQNLSEYIEVDLNMTHVGMKTDVSDMSITDTIHSPKVQELSKSINKKINAPKDWILDKENIAINPYITPRESVNFAVNEEPDKVLVFDGKKLIVQTENENYRQTLLPNMSEASPKRKTIVVNCNDDLPNFIDDAQVSNASGFFGVSEMRRSMIFDGDMSITQLRLDEPEITRKTEKQQSTILYDDELGDISVTQAVSNVIAPKIEKRQTILYESDTGNISITQAVPSSVIDKEKRKTVLYENNTSNISITQAVPIKVILTNDNSEKRKTIIYENEACNISTTEVIPIKIIAPDNAPTKRRTIVFENDNGNVSITQAIPNVVIRDGNETLRTVVYNKTGNISITMSISSNLTQDTSPEQDHVEIGNISVAQAIPSNIIKPQDPNVTSYQDENNISMTQAVPTNILLADDFATNRRRTVLYENETGNLSITQAVISNQVIQELRNLESCKTKVLNESDAYSNVSKVGVETDDVDLSMTQAVNLNQILPGYMSKPQEKRRTIVFDDDDADISVTQAVPVNKLIDAINEQKQKEVDLIESTYTALHNKDSTEQKKVAFEWEDADVSIPQAAEQNPFGRSRTIMYDDDENNISMTQAIPANVILPEQQKRTIVHEDVDPVMKNDDLVLTEAKPVKEQQKRITIVYEDAYSMLKNEEIILTETNTAKDQHKRRTIDYENVKSMMKNQDLVLTVANPIKEQQKRTTIANEDINPVMKNEDFLLTEANPTKEQQKRRSIAYEDVNPVIRNVNLVLTEASPVKKQQKRTIVYEDINPMIKNKDLVLAEAYPVKEQQKRITIVYKDADSMLKNEEIIMTKTNPAKEQQKSRTFLYENDNSVMKEEDLPSTEANPRRAQQKKTIVYENVDSILKNTHLLTEDNPRKEQKKSILVDDANAMLENKELFMEIDKLIDGSQQKEEIELDVSITEVNDANKSKRKTIVDNHEKSITQSIFQQVSPNETQNIRGSVLFDEPANTTLSKPIPAELSVFQCGIIDKSLKKDTSARISMLQNLTNVASDILVYHAAAAGAQSLEKTGADNDDTKSQDIVAIANEGETILSAKNSNDLDQISHDLMKTEFQKPNYEQSYPKPFVSSLEETKDTAVEMPAIKSKNSILSDLLDMSNSSMQGTENKILMTDNVSEHSAMMAPGNLETECSTNVRETEPLFFITNDSDEDSPINNSEINFKSVKKENAKKINKISEICEKSILPIEYAEKEESAIVGKLKKKLSELKSVLKIDNSHKNVEPESTNSADVVNKKILNKSKKDVLSKSGKSFKMANDTSDLLDVLSDFTDIRKSKNSNPTLEEDEEIPEPVMIKGHLALENKEKIGKPELKRNFDLNPRAGAALHKSSLELGKFDVEDMAKETPEIPHKKSVRMSTEVVKTLHFDEEDSCNEISIQTEKTDTILTPLKKTAFGEISYMKEGKAKVIPDFLKAVPDSVKELMDDLVKPMADVLPFTATRHKTVKNSASTCSNQIQANLLTSSQIDLCNELYSNPESEHDMQKFSSVDIITDAVNRSVTRALKVPLKSTSMVVQSEKSLPISSHDTDFRPAVSIEPVHGTLCATKYPEMRDTQGEVLIFDHTNPLNNVLLIPHVDPMDVHKYNPVQSTETISGSEKNAFVEISHHEADKDMTVDRVTTQYHIQSKLRPLEQIFDSSEIADTPSDISKPYSTDQSVDVVNDFKDIQVNTIIAMKGNKELLEASSSLTLVDDTLAHRAFDVDLDSRTVSSQNTDGLASLGRVLEVEKLLSEKLETNVSFKEENKNRSFKSKKRIYSPTKRDRHEYGVLSVIDVTPKPVSKVARHSHSPVDEKPTKLPAERDEPAQEQVKSHIKSMNRKPGTTITIQQMTMHVESANQGVKSTTNSGSNQEEPEVERDNDASSEETPQTGSRTCASEELEASVEMASSFTSSVNLEADSVASVRGSDKLKMECAQDTSSSVTSSKTPTECDSSVDMVDFINMLPFMGSHECEWECSSGETWSFRLLHSRLRLTMRFPRNTRVRPDTRVLDVALDTIYHDKKNPLGTLCVKFASAAMRWHTARGGGAAPLLRRLAGAARLAAAWARAMHDARARLAYTLTDDGRLVLKVANMTLRCVWEVTMQLELAEEGGAAPWPRAGEVRVRRVLAAAGAAPPPSAAAVSRALGATPLDWGHAPRTVWKIFRYLKYKKRDDDVFLQ